MAFKDANGRITIDEVAAQKDITSIRAAIQDLQTARDSLSELRYQAQSFSGKTAVSIEETSTLLISEYDKLITYLEETISTINTTVGKYQRIDEEVKNLINSQE